MAVGTSVFRIRIELIFRWCWKLITPWGRSGTAQQGISGSSRAMGPTLDAAVFEKGVETPMLRKRGGQPGNRNAVTHGRYSKPLRAARLAALQTTMKEREQRKDAWIKMVPVTDYDGIVDELRAIRRAKEAN
jgi:hypothetical protein